MRGLLFWASSESRYDSARTGSEVREALPWSLLIGVIEPTHTLLPDEIMVSSSGVHKRETPENGRRHAVRVSL